MYLTDLHRRLLRDVLAIGTPYPLVITGGYAVQAHGLVERLSPLSRPAVSQWIEVQSRKVPPPCRAVAPFCYWGVRPPNPLKGRREGRGAHPPGVRGGYCDVGGGGGSGLGSGEGDGGGGGVSEVVVGDELDGVLARVPGQAPV
ncbi:hypothetical protein E5671_00450 [Streptomyces sp. BA2]|nr:hypothetical protein [Streptomyces sp. BA2]